MSGMERDDMEVQPRRAKASSEESRQAKVSQGESMRVRASQGESIQVEFHLTELAICHIALGIVRIQNHSGTQQAWSREFSSS